MLSKRLGEVTEELKKTEAREAKLKITMEEQEKKYQSLTDQLNQIESGKANETDSMNSLTSKLTEANNRVSELEKMFTSVETQLKESQETQSRKDKEIQVLNRNGWLTYITWSIVILSTINLHFFVGTSEST